MKVTEADHLADLIQHTWTTRIPAQIWADALLPLSPQLAHRAWVSLRDSEKAAPTIAQFRGKYDALVAATRDTAARAREPFDESAAATAMETYAALRGKGSTSLSALSAACLAAGEAHRNASGQLL